MGDAVDCKAGFKTRLSRNRARATSPAVTLHNMMLVRGKWTAFVGRGFRLSRLELLS